MEITPLTSKQPSIDPMAQNMSEGIVGKNASSNDAKIAESCKQFEAVLWRQMLEKAFEPMLNQAGPGADKTGTYNYFLTNTISESVSGSPNGISSLLQAQILQKIKPHSI